jgi:hypothetical protein
MVAPITTLRTVQVGVEATRGTLVPATSILDYVEANISRNPNISHIRTGGSLATSHRAVALHEEVEITVSGRCSYNWLPWWYNLFLGPLAAGTGASADKTWTFGSAVVSDTADNVKSASFEIGGKDTWPTEFKVSGVVGKTLHISMDVNADDGAWQYEATLLGTVVTQASKTGALAVVSSITDVQVQNTKVYVNSSASAFGNTQKTGTVISADITIELGMAQRFTLSGTNTATRTAMVGPRNITGTLVAEWDATTDSTSLFAVTSQRIRFEAIGAVLGGGTYKSNIDIPCVFDTLGYSDDDGVIVEELEFTAQYDTTPAADINAVVVNASAALP